MQRVFWRWKDDDLTSDMNSWLNGVIEKGLIRGFDAALSSDMNLVLSHTSSGVIKTKLDATLGNATGIIYSGQGSLISEDASITLPIDIGGSLPRIDTIYAEHVYTEVVGGTPVTYSVIKGTESATPVAPALINSNIEIKLGELYVPAGLTALNAGALYTKVPGPKFAGQNYAHRDEVNRYTKQAQIAYKRSDISYDSTAKRLTINDNSNDFDLPDAINTTSNYLKYISPTPVGTEITLYLGSNGAQIQSSFETDGIFNYVEQFDVAIYPQYSILYFRSRGTGYDLVDVSARGIYWGANRWRGTNQKLFAQTPGVRLIQISYVVGSTTYNPWILEINPLADQFVLDMSNVAQTNGYNATGGGVIDYRIISLLPGLRSSGEGYNPVIEIKGASGYNLKATTAGNPLPVSGYPLYKGSNLELAFREDTNNTFFIHKGTDDNVYSRVQYKFLPGGVNFVMTPESRLENILGGTNYTVNSLGITKDDSHRAAIDKLAVAQSPVHENLSLLGVATNIVNGTVPVFNGHNFSMVRTGKLVNFTYDARVSINTGYSFMSFDLPTGLNLNRVDPTDGNGSVGAGFGIGAGSPQDFGQVWMYTNTSMSSGVVKVHLNVGDAAPADTFFMLRLTGTFILN